MEPMPIVNPLIIVHQPDEQGKLETIIGSPGNLGHSHFGLVIADIIRHVARAFDVDDADVLEWVHREMDMPTTILTGSKVQ